MLGIAFYNIPTKQLSNQSILIIIQQLCALFFPRAMWTPSNPIESEIFKICPYGKIQNHYIGLKLCMVWHLLFLQNVFVLFLYCYHHTTPRLQRKNHSHILDPFSHNGQELYSKCFYVLKIHMLNLIPTMMVFGGGIFGGA